MGKKEVERKTMTVSERNFT